MNRTEWVDSERTKARKLYAKAQRHADRAVALRALARRLLDELFPIPAIVGCCNSIRQCDGFKAHWVFSNEMLSGIEGEPECLEVQCLAVAHATVVRFYLKNRCITGSLGGTCIPQGSQWRGTSAGGMFFKMGETRWIETEKVAILS